MKQRLDWFPLNTENDNKLDLIEAEFGQAGFAVVVQLFRKIYGTEGYYCEWTKEVELLFCKKLGFSRGDNFVSEIVSASLRRDIFNKELFDKFSILTSKAIQRNFLKASLKRKGIFMKKDYLLISDTQLIKNVGILEENDGIFKENDGIFKQMRREENISYYCYKEFENNIGFLSPAIAQEMQSYIDDGIDDQVVILAINEAVENNKRSWKYIKAILNNCIVKNIKTVTGFKQAQAEHLANKISKTEQNKPQANQFNQNKAPKNKFVNFPQQDINYEEFDKQLLNKRLKKEC